MTYGNNPTANDLGHLIVIVGWVAVPIIALLIVAWIIGNLHS